MRSLSSRVPPPAGFDRWTQDMADHLIGKRAVLQADPFPSVVGEVVAANVRDDELGHALWVTVQTPDEAGADFITDCVGRVSLDPA